MKIIKKGDINKNKSVLLFECPKCESIFKEHKRKCKAFLLENYDYYCCECPICGENVFVSIKRDDNTTY